MCIICTLRGLSKSCFRQNWVETLCNKQDCDCLGKNVHLFDYVAHDSKVKLRHLSKQMITRQNVFAICNFNLRSIHDDVKHFGTVSLLDKFKEFVQLHNAKEIITFYQNLKTFQLNFTFSDICFWHPGTVAKENQNIEQNIILSEIW